MKIIDLQPVIKPDVTIIPNSILDQYLPEANELQLKVYLYILRTVNAGTPVQISVMADYFNETEKDVTRAISFWEKRGVFSCGQSAASPQTVSGSMQTQADAANSASSSRDVMPSAMDTVPGIRGTADQTAGSVSRTASASAPSDIIRNISRDSFQSFAGSEDFGELRFVAETYMGKPLSSNDLHILLFIKENLGFSNELIDFLLQHCAECDKKSFHYVQKVACEWSKQGITTPDEAQAHCAMYNKKVYTIMNALGKKNDPTNAELDYIERWYQQYGFEADVILEACRRTVLATDRNRFSYADKILSSWHTSGVHHSSDISRADASFQSQKKQTASRKAPGYVANNPFLQHQSSKVDYDALEKELLQN